MTVTATDRGFRLGDRTVPWWSGELHYWRVEPDRWGSALDSLVELGFEQVSTYVPWEVHERADGTFDFTGQRDVEAFLRLAQDRGLTAIVRPGPDCGAELPGSGWPRRIIEQPDCQALRPDGTPYLLLMATAHGTPPSYASTAFRTEVRRWYDAVAPRLAAMQWPDGPIVACQVDNENGYHFQPNAFAMDHHPDALDRWHRYLEERFGSVDAMNDALGETWPSFSEVAAPSSADDGSSTARRLAWVGFRERLRIDVLGELAAELRERGIDRVPTFHNDYPRVESPIHLSRLETDGAVDISTLDIYLPRQAADVAMGLARRLAGSSRLPVVAETGGGWMSLPWLLPAACRSEDPDTLLPRILGAGSRGLNIYMAVERDRWYASPIDRHGRIRSGWDAPYRRVSALIRDHLFAHQRRARVLLVENRAEQRRHAARDLCGDAVACFAQVVPMDLRLTTGVDPDARRADVWLDDVASRLEAVGIDHDRCTDVSPHLDRYELVVFASAGAADPAVLARLRSQVTGRLVVGPDRPTMDELLRPRAVDVEVVSDPAAVVAMLAESDASVGPEVVIHRWEGPFLRLVVANRTDAPVTAAVPVDGRVVDVESGDAVPAEGGVANIELAPWGVRLVEVSS